VIKREHFRLSAQIWRLFFTLH